MRPLVQRYGPLPEQQKMSGLLFFHAGLAKVNRGAGHFTPSA
jgi:hypothetical protein